MHRLPTAYRWAILFLTLLAPVALDAQEVERRVPFDSAGRVQVITPVVAQRLSLQGPEWPVTGEFQEARLFQTSTGFVLAVERRDGSVERRILSAADREALRARIDAALPAGGRPLGEEGTTLGGETAGGRFVATHSALGLSLYGPAASVLVAGDGDNGSGAAAAYLGVAGLSFFISYGVSRNQVVSRAQAELSGFGAPYGGALGAGLLYVIAEDGPGAAGYGGTVLLGSVAGAIAGFQQARRLTTAEARGMALGGQALGLLAGGTLGAANAFDAAGRGAVAATMGASLIGLPAGLRYVRRASYVVTAGDVDAVGTAGLLGAATLFAPIAESGMNDKAKVALATAGYGLGLLVGDAAFARRYDYTQNEASLLYLGATAGALIGSALTVGAADGAVKATAATVGALLGTMITHGIVSPKREGERRSGGSRIAVRATPMNAMLVAAKVPGALPLVQVRF